MDTQSYKTISANKENAKKEWFLVDAENEVVGRLASRVAMILRGKHKTNYTPHADCGDYVVVINAEKAIFTGKKLTDKEYVRHSGFPGGQSHNTPVQMLAKKPTFVLETAIKGMLPKTKLGEAMFRNLKVYAGTEHAQQAQQPKIIDLNTIK